MKTLLTLLLLIPSLSLGHVKTTFTLEEFQEGHTVFEYCSTTDEYKKWKSKYDKVAYKRELYTRKCFLEHVKGNDNSDLAVKTIYQSCEVLAEDKYKFSEEQPNQIINNETKELYLTLKVAEYNCHSHD